MHKFFPRHQEYQNSVYHLCACINSCHLMIQIYRQSEIVLVFLDIYFIFLFFCSWFFHSTSQSQSDSVTPCHSSMERCYLRDTQLYLQRPSIRQIKKRKFLCQRASKRFAAPLTQWHFGVATHRVFRFASMSFSRSHLHESVRMAEEHVAQLIVVSSISVFRIETNEPAVAATAAAAAASRNINDNNRQRRVVVERCDLLATSACVR